MVERDDAGEFVRIRCDWCDAPAPPTADLIINFGLNNMGWHCMGGNHTCASCREAAPIDKGAERAVPND